MKKALLMIILLSFGFFTSAQVARDLEIENEINKELWKPFKKAWEQRDAAAFNNLHTKDVLRVSKWGGIKIGSEYTDRISESYKKPDNRERTIDFWLEHRYYSGNTGYEVGYLKIVSKEPGKEPRQSFSRFHVVLKKVEGQWKIAQDWDTSNINGVEVTETDFNKGSALDLAY
ncbi:MAG: nuclear transport factor 2 family protein [Cyclobacteriaceae bacterium]